MANEVVVAKADGDFSALITDTVNARDAAQAAENGAISARNAAQAARDDAQAAKNSAESAETTAVNAKNDAESAESTAQSAASTATTARDDAQTAETGAENARDAAEGFRDAAQDFAGDVKTQIDNINAAAAAGPARAKVYLDVGYAINTDNVYNSASDALAQCRGLVDAGIEPVTLIVGMETDSEPYGVNTGDPVAFFNEYVSGYSESSQDSKVLLHSPLVEAQRQRLLLRSTYDDATAAFDLVDTELAINLTI